MKNLFIEELKGVNISVNTLNCLNHNMIYTLGDVLKYNILDLRKLRGINQRIWEEIQSIVEYYYKNIKEA